MNRIDPYKNFKFQLEFQDQVILGVSKVSMLKRSTEVVSHRDGGDLSTPRHSPGMTSFEPITLERGITFDSAFEEWANAVYSTEGDGAISLATYKRELILNVYNLQRVVVRRYNITRAWVSEYTALPELDSNANAIAIESLVLQNEGWSRDVSVQEQVET
jgi:phage tail-like protein